MGKPDQTVEVWVDGEPADAGNPLPVTNPAGVGGLTDAELRATPVKVDDDATQALLTAAAVAATPASAVAQVADATLVAGACRLHGFSMGNTSSIATAKAYLRDGAAGTILAIVTLAEDESVRDSFGDRGVAIATGVYLDWVSGSVDVSVTTSPA